MERLTITALQPGRPWPLGAHFDGRGVNFAVFSANATGIELCLFDNEGAHEIGRLPLPLCTNNVWHGYLPQAQPGLVYGLRAHGPWRPDQGHRFDASKLLLDPYARDIVGDFIWSDEHFTPDAAHPRHMTTRDNAALALKARVVHDEFDWHGDKSPQVSMLDTVLYECHVKGFSKLQLMVPPELRGSFAALAHASSIDYFTRLGITTLTLLPVHYGLSEERLVKLGLTNYWNYNTIGFFCPDRRYVSKVATSSPRDEFRRMVRRLHAAGLEVILDVVYNHTAEADHMGPTLSFRGLDNASYYRLKPSDPSQNENFSGCGNTLNLSHPRVLQMVMDSLRYWAADMHVDGFRFDLAPVLGRTDSGFDPQSAFFAAIAQDPVLSRVKLIAEPWDIGPGGYQVGSFPRGWYEWNDKFRDGMRRFWLQGAANTNEAASRGEFAMRLCASSDVYQRRKRPPAKSINYVVSHDGFTLCDLVSYQHKHNEANGETNQDGHSHNNSFNCGVEGPSSDPAIQSLRSKLQRALLATTLLAQGTPMLHAGDEISHSQDGNNNPYCQDNATTWIDWAQADQDLLAFTSLVIALRRQLHPFANTWYSGVADVDGIYDLSWYNANGSVLQGEQWHAANVHALACLIGRPGGTTAPLMVLINNNAQAQPFVLPPGAWQALLDTHHPRGWVDSALTWGASVDVQAYSLVLFKQISLRQRM